MFDQKNRLKAFEDAVSVPTFIYYIYRCTNTDRSYFYFAIK